MAIKLKNGHEIKYVIGSGALAFDGKGWLYERPLVALRHIQPELFTVVLKSLKLKKIKGNYVWWHPWTCIRPILGGAVNKVGLTSPGFDYWLKNIAPKIDFSKGNIVVSFFGEVYEIIEMINKTNHLNIAAYEINSSCPNSGSKLDEAQVVINNTKRIKGVSRHPLIFKVSVTQDYLAIAKGLVGIAEAISLNSVPWEKVFPDKVTPLWRLEKKVKGGGGGVSGKPAQELNWKAVRELSEQGFIPVIAPSVMEFDDMEKVRKLGASAVSFCAIHLPDHDWWHFWKPWKHFTWFTNPCKPTKFVRKEMEK